MSEQAKPSARSVIQAWRIDKKHDGGLKHEDYLQIIAYALDLGFMAGASQSKEIFHKIIDEIKEGKDEA